MRPNFSVTAATISVTDSLLVTSTRRPMAAAAEFLRRGHGGLLVDVGDHDRGALRGQFLGDTAADTAAGAGD